MLRMLTFFAFCKNYWSYPVLALSLALVSVIGDKVVFESRYSHIFLFRAITDNLIHALIGLLYATIFLCGSKELSGVGWNVDRYIGICVLVSSIIDFDHILVAKSLRLSNLREFKHRGILHCTTVCCVPLVGCLVLAYQMQRPHYIRVIWMFLLAFISHHVRDAKRRGFWLYPFGHTSPINNYVYTPIIVLIPFILRNIKFHKPEFTVHNKFIV